MTMQDDIKRSPVQDEEDMDRPSDLPRPPGNVAGTSDVTGEPGVESALGRDQSQAELPRELGTNRLGDAPPGGPDAIDVAGLPSATDRERDETTSVGTTGAAEMGDASGGLRDGGD